MRTMLHAAVVPEAVVVDRGEQGALSVAITNTSDVIDAYRVQVLGLDPSWVNVVPEQVSLFPGVTAQVEITFDLPHDYPSSTRTIAINTTSEQDATQFSLVNVELAVRPQITTSVTIDPIVVNGGRSAVFGAVVKNLGNTSIVTAVAATDPEDLASFEYSSTAAVGAGPSDTSGTGGVVRIAPGRSEVVHVKVTGGRTWLGQPRARTFTFNTSNRVDDGTFEDGPAAIGTFIQRPRISRWILSLLGLLAAAVVFATVIWLTIGRPINQVNQNIDDARGTVDDALQDTGPPGVRIPINPGTIGGVVRLASTDEGIGAVTVELFTTEDPTSPITSGTTAGDGTFSLAGLPEREYLVRLSGAGIQTVWFPAAKSSDDADPVEVAARQTTSIDIVVGGVPVTVEGAVTIADPGPGAAGGSADLSDVTLTLLKSGVIEPGIDAVVAEVSLAADGSFTMPDVPSPGTYQLVVQRPGSATESRMVTIQPGEAIDGISVSLLPGEGVVSGLVSRFDGTALGGATITATDGSQIIETVTLTQGDVGTYTLRDLAVPGQYTVTVEAVGNVPETRTIALTGDAPSATFDSRLAPSVGSISGSATIGGAPARGLQVAITGGPVSRTTGVVSQGGDAGTYAFDGLPLPGTYTLTFSGGGTEPQVQVVDLSSATNNGVRTGVNVSLSRSNATISGRVILDSPGVQAAARATVTLTDGTMTRVIQSSSGVDAGRFEFSDVPPGSYTITASRTGSVDDVRLVTVVASTTPDFVTMRLGTTASVSGRVFGTGFVPERDTAEIRVYLPANFPAPNEQETQVRTDSTGAYVIEGLDAPVTYFISVHRVGADGVASVDPIDSRQITTVRGQRTSGIDFDVSP